MSAPAYVIGFLFAPRYERVVLIEKRKPAWQAGLLNGVGGKIEPGETPEEAIARECAEECGVALPAHGWSLIATELAAGGIGDGRRPTLYFLKVMSARAGTAHTCEAEKILLVEPHYLPRNVIPNVRWLVPLALDPGVGALIRIHGSGAYGRGVLRAGDPLAPQDGGPV